MVYAVVVLSGVILILMILLIRIHRQLKDMNQQLEKRYQEKSKQLLCISMHSQDFTKLTANINQCLRDEEKMLMDTVKNEKEFRQLIASVSHDLRTPLTAIRGYLQLLHSCDLTPRENEDLEIAIKYSEELGSLIEHFFEYTYLVDANPQMNLVRLNLSNLVIECIMDSVNQFEAKGIAVEMEEGPTIFAYVDKEMTVRIVQNLVRNCLAHSAGNLKVAIEHKPMEAIIHFSNPIKEGYRIDASKIFERFYTGDDSRHHTSSGLGLSIVKLLSEKMGGRAEASVKDNIITISVVFPLESDVVD